MKDCIQGKTTALTKTRKELLDELGFVWQVRNRPEWSSKFEELVAYKNKYGDTVSRSSEFLKQAIEIALLTVFLVALQRVPQHWAENKTLGKVRISIFYNIER